MRLDTHCTCIFVHVHVHVQYISIYQSSQSRLLSEYVVEFVNLITVCIILCTKGGFVTSAYNGRLRDFL